MELSGASRLADFDLELLADLIIGIESANGDPNSLAMRSNNPGNLAFKGQKGASPGEGLHDMTFAKFDSLEAGRAALVNQLDAYASGRSAHTDSTATLQEVMHIYAPAQHGNNDPVAYADSLVKGYNHSSRQQGGAMNSSRQPGGAMNQGQKNQGMPQITLEDLLLQSALEQVKGHDQQQQTTTPSNAVNVNTMNQGQKNQGLRMMGLGNLIPSTIPGTDMSALQTKHPSLEEMLLPAINSLPKHLVKSLGGYQPGMYQTQASSGGSTSQPQLPAMPKHLLKSLPGFQPLPGGWQLGMHQASLGGNTFQPSPFLTPEDYQGGSTVPQKFSRPQSYITGISEAGPGRVVSPQGSQLGNRAGLANGEISVLDLADLSVDPGNPDPTRYAAGGKARDIVSSTLNNQQPVMPEPAMPPIYKSTEIPEKSFDLTGATSADRDKDKDKDKDSLFPLMMLMMMMGGGGQGGSQRPIWM